MTVVATDEELQLQIAWRAVKRVQSMHTQLEAILRAVARNPKLKLKFHAESSMTDGKETVWLKVPWELGRDDVAHDRLNCKNRRPNGVKACKRCEIDEEIFIVILHEAAHIISDSFEQIPPHERKEALAHAIRQHFGGKHSERAETLIKRIGEAPPEKFGNVIILSEVVSPYMKSLLNLIEDTRVNANMARSRPGTKIMFQAHYARVFDDGMVQQDGSVVHWRERPVNSQACIGVFCKVLGLPYEDYLTEEVVIGLDDAELDRLTAKAAQSATVRELYGLTFPVLERLRELGFCRDVDDPEDNEPDPGEGEPGQGDPDTGQDSTDSPSGDGSGDTADSEGNGADGDDKADDNGGEGGSDDDADGNDSDATDGSGDADAGEPEDDSGSSSSGSTGGEEGNDEAGAEDGSDGQGEPGQSGGSPGGSGSDGRSEDDREQCDGPNDSGGDQESGPGSEGSPSSGEPQGNNRSPGDGEVTNHGGSGGAGPLDNSHLTQQRHPPMTPERQEEMGTAEAVDQDLNVFGGHPEKNDPTAETAQQAATRQQEERAEEEMKEAVEKALAQATHFDDPSHECDGLRVCTWDEYQGRKAWDPDNRPWRNNDREEVPEHLLMKSLTQLRIVFADNRKGKDERNLKRGRTVDAGRLHRFYTEPDKPRLFHTRTPPGKKDYTVAITVDVSGSTGNGALAMLKTAVAAQAELLKRLGIPFTVFAHSGDDAVVEMFVIKALKEPWDAKTLERLDALQPYSYNIDGHSLEFVRKQAEQTNSTHQIVMFYTDGRLNNLGEEYAVFSKQVEIARKNNTTICGVAVGRGAGLPAELGLPMTEMNSVEEISNVVNLLREQLMH